MTRSSTRQSFFCFLGVLLLQQPGSTFGFVLPHPTTVSSSSSSSSVGPSSSRLWAAANNDKNKVMDQVEVKRQLEEYLERRIEANADEVAKQERGKIIGGTKGNKVLEYISGAPVKEQVIDRIPNIFDYDELSKYGYSSLVTPIMNLGGRRAVYEMMGMEAPAVPKPPPKKTAQKLVFDRTGENDQARYTGLKMGQVLDDNTMAEALERANKKTKEGVSLRRKLMEEEYERPFADKRNTGPQQTPDWTVETLDEYTKAQGQALSWAKRAKLGEFLNDPDEVMDLDLGLRLYCIAVAFEFCFAFGKSTPSFLHDMVGLTTEASRQLTGVLQAPGFALAVASIGSSVACGFFLAPERNRDSFVWAVKGLMGGPLAVRRLQGLEALITRGAQEDLDKESRAASKSP